MRKEAVGPNSNNLQNEQTRASQTAIPTQNGRIYLRGSTIQKWMNRSVNIRPIRLISEPVPDQRYLLTQRERITLALIAQSEAVSAIELVEQLELTDTMVLRSWLGRLITLKLLNQSGRTKATRYFVPPPLLREVGLDTLTTLTRVQPHRLRSLVFEDLERFPDSSRSEIHRGVGTAIPERPLRRTLEDLVKFGDVCAVDEKR